MDNTLPTGAATTLVLCIVLGEERRDYKGSTLVLDWGRNYLPDFAWEKEEGWHKTHTRSPVGGSGCRSRLSDHWGNLRDTVPADWMLRLFSRPSQPSKTRSSSHKREWTLLPSDCFWSIDWLLSPPTLLLSFTWAELVLLLPLILAFIWT